MCFFKTNFIRVLCIAIILRKSFSQPKADPQEKCKKSIKKIFKHYDPYKGGLIAIENLTTEIAETQLDEDARGYYESYLPFLEADQVPKPSDFCNDYYGKRLTMLPPYSTTECVIWIEHFFGNDMLTIVQKAFYTYNFKSIKDKEILTMIPDPKLKDFINSALKFYFHSIRDNYGLRTTDFKNPFDFCAKKYNSYTPASTSTARDAQE